MHAGNFPIGSAKSDFALSMESRSFLNLFLDSSQKEGAHTLLGLCLCGNLPSCKITKVLNELMFLMTVLMRGIKAEDTKIQKRLCRVEAICP